MKANSKKTSKSTLKEFKSPSSALKKRGLQQRSLNTKEKLLKVAAKCLVDEGIHSLRFSNIAKKADMPQPLVGYHFPTTESLLMGIFLVEVEKLKTYSIKSIEKHLSEPREALGAYIRSPFEMAKKDRTFRVCWTAFYHLCTISNEFVALNDQIRKTGRERILNLISMVLATEGRFLGKKAPSRQELLSISVRIQAIMTGHLIMAATESLLEYDHLAEQAVKTCFALIEEKES